MCKILQSRYKVIRPRFECHPKHGLPVVGFLAQRVWFFATLHVGGPYSPKVKTSRPGPSLDMAIWDRLNLARKRVLERGQWPPPQLWMLLWLKDGLWGSNIDYLQSGQPLELQYFKQLSREPYAGEQEAQPAQTPAGVLGLALSGDSQPSLRGGLA